MDLGTGIYSGPEEISRGVIGFSVAILHLDTAVDFCYPWPTIFMQ